MVLTQSCSKLLASSSRRKLVTACRAKSRACCEVSGGREGSEGGGEASEDEDIRLSAGIELERGMVIGLIRGLLEWSAPVDHWQEV